MMSDDAKRYMICGGGAHEAPGGTWVRADDYDRLRAEVERLRASNDFLRHCTQGFVFISEHGEMETWVCAECRGKNWRDDYGVWITDEQIDAAWLASRGSESSRSILRLCGIVECTRCQGTGELKPRATDGVIYPRQKCPACHGHGWIREERGDE